MNTVLTMCCIILNDSFSRIQSQWRNWSPCSHCIVHIYNIDQEARHSRQLCCVHIMNTVLTMCCIILNNSFSHTQSQWRNWSPCGHCIVHIYNVYGSLTCFPEIVSHTHMEGKSCFCHPQVYSQQHNMQLSSVQYCTDHSE